MFNVFTTATGSALIALLLVQVAAVPVPALENTIEQNHPANLVSNNPVSAIKWSTVAAPPHSPQPIISSRFPAHSRAELIARAKEDTIEKTPANDSNSLISSIKWSTVQASELKQTKPLVKQLQPSTASTHTQRAPLDSIRAYSRAELIGRAKRQDLEEREPMPMPVGLEERQAPPPAPALELVDKRQLSVDDLQKLVAQIQQQIAQNGLKEAGIQKEQNELSGVKAGGLVKKSNSEGLSRKADSEKAILLKRDVSGNWRRQVGRREQRMKSRLSEDVPTWNYRS